MWVWCSHWSITHLSTKDSVKASDLRSYGSTVSNSDSMYFARHRQGVLWRILSARFHDIDFCVSCPTVLRPPLFATSLPAWEWSHPQRNHTWPSIHPNAQSSSLFRLETVMSFLTRSSATWLIILLTHLSWMSRDLSLLTTSRYSSFRWRFFTDCSVVSVVFQALVFFRVQFLLRDSGKTSGDFLTGCRCLHCSCYGLRRRQQKLSILQLWSQLSLIRSSWGDLAILHSEDILEWCRLSNKFLPHVSRHNKSSSQLTIHVTQRLHSRM